MTSNSTPFERAPATGAHGGGLRGESVYRGSRTFQGRFGRMFRALPAAEFDGEALFALAMAMSAEPETIQDAEKREWPAAELEDNLDDEENLATPAGYTYLGQFIDHDITFDPVSSLQRQNDVDALVNFRTPALDLDSVYGRGPDAQPYLYQDDGKRFLLGRKLTQGGVDSASRDLPRVSTGRKQRALIGDPRNDENVIVSQLHGTFLQFHNRLIDDGLAGSFQEAQRLVRWHYQYVVLNDFLPRIVGLDGLTQILPGWSPGQPLMNPPSLRFYHPREDAYIPIEFSAAAYRFGHSMVRPIYRLNPNHDGGRDPRGATEFERDAGLAGRFFIFAGVQKRGLNGGDAFPDDWAIDWSLYFNSAGVHPSDSGSRRVQPAYKIDPSLVNPLAFLSEFSRPPLRPGTTLTVKALQLKPDTAAGRGPANLALRNLIRGHTMGLPTGQDVARAMGLEPIPDNELRVGKAQWIEEDQVEDGILLAEVIDKFGKPGEPARLRDHFKQRAPLWFYVLAEARALWSRTRQSGNFPGDPNRIPVHLGPVGGRIVAETLIGLLTADSHSYLNQHPLWTPRQAGTFQSGSVYGMGDFIKYALQR